MVFYGRKLDVFTLNFTEGWYGIYIVYVYMQNKGEE